MDLIPFEGGCVLIAGAFVPFLLVAISDRQANCIGAQIKSPLQLVFLGF